MRTTLDFSPYRRSLIGFDHLFDLMENAARLDFAEGHPPYDVEQRGEDAYRIRLAVAGYAISDIDVTTHENVLIVTGKKEEKGEDGKYLYHSIAAGGFERRFQLADHVKVIAANLADGILQIDLERDVPEAAKPRKIAIGQASEPKRITKTTQAETA